MDREFLEKCLAEGMSLREIGEIAGLEKSTVSYHVKKHGLVPVNQAKATNKGGICEEVLEIMFDDGLSLAEMAEQLDLSVSTVRYWLKKYGFGPTSGSLKRKASRTAKEAGLKNAILKCRHHGMTKHVLESRGTYRCMRCRQDNVAEWRRRSKLRLVDEAGGACATCGYNDCVAALEFHHLDPEQKRFPLSRRGITRAFAELQAEARKCVLLCANCHAEVECGFRTLPPELLARLKSRGEEAA